MQLEDFDPNFQSLNPNKVLSEKEDDTLLEDKVESGRIMLYMGQTAEFSKKDVIKPFVADIVS